MSTSASSMSAASGINPQNQAAMSEIYTVQTTNSTSSSHTNTLRLPSSLSFWILSVLSAYWLLVRTLRYRRRDGLTHRSNYPDRSSWSRMTVKDAHSVHVSLTELEFPIIFHTSTFFALFKTYGIPSISKLLVATGQLSCPETASKRAADTATIMTEAIINEPDSERAISGIARMNYLHNRYIKAGKISNDDMLYTLSLFVLEPIRWTARYEWRTVTDFERCAMGVYWKDMGEAMKISYDTLPSAGQGWRDGFHWLEEVEAWSLAYEAQNMVPAETNATLGRGTFDVALFNVPSALKPLSFTVAYTLLEPRLRKAMNIPQPPAIYYQVLETLVEIRKFLLRNFFLPRPYFLRPDWFTEIDERTGRANAGQYIDRPWYVKPSLMKRWGPNALLLRLVGGVVPGDERYHPRGYRIHELGPSELVGKGDAEMRNTRDELRAKRMGVRCSMATSFGQVWKELRFP